MNEDAYYSNTYIRKTRDRLYKILCRQPSIEEIQSQVIGLSYNELLNLIEHEIINSLLSLAGERDIVIDDIRKECRKWGLNDDEVEKLSRWASDAGLFEAGTDPYAGELKPQNEEPALELKTDYPSLEELIAVKKKIPDFKETVIVGKDEVVRNFRLEALDEIKADLVRHKQSHEMITPGDFEFELRVWSVPKAYVEQLAEYAYSLNENGIPSKTPEETENVEEGVKNNSVAEIQDDLLVTSMLTDGAMDMDDFEDEPDEESWSSDAQIIAANETAKKTDEGFDEYKEYLEDMAADAYNSDEFFSLDIALDAIQDFMKQSSDINADCIVNVMNLGDVKQLNVWAEDNNITTIEIEKGTSAEVTISDELPFSRGRIVISAVEEGITVIHLCDDRIDNDRFIAVLVI